MRSKEKKKTVGLSKRSTQVCNKSIVRGNGHSSMDDSGRRYVMFKHDCEKELKMHGHIIGYGRKGEFFFQRIYAVRKTLSGCS